MQPSTSSATSATTMEVSTFQTLEDAKPQAKRKWRRSFSKIKILQEATSFDLYADLFGNLGMKFIPKNSTCCSL